MLDLPQEVSATIPPGTRVYKDESIYTYDTPENNSLGLDLDLVTYRAYSRGSTYDHTGQNYRQSGNRWYLNITRTPKPESQREEERAAKMPKLEPKLQVVDVKDEDLYDEKVGVYDAKENTYYPYTDLSEAFRELLDSILKANSSNTQDAVQEWEQMIATCTHSENVTQEHVTTDLTQCRLCDLRENLWVCLSCGQTGCGRQQYGSDLKGNSHALQHYEETGHAVAVKLGSLSADSADAYCYKCGDEVKVPELAALLHTYGIDIASAVKTEKNLVELNIDRNMKWEFRLDGADGTKLPPVFGSGKTGLRNLGNSCYLNAVVQALFSLPEYKANMMQYVQDGGSDTDLPNNLIFKDPLQHQLARLYDGLFSGRYSVPSVLNDGYQLGIKPTVFKNLLGEGHEEFSTSRQQDAHEFLTHFLARAEAALGVRFNLPLKFVSQTGVLCTSCNSATLRTNLEDNLVVQMEGEDNVSLIDCVSRSFEVETVDGYTCDECQAKGAAIRTSGFVSFPENLVVGVSRIRLENWVPKKIDTPIEVPYSLDLSELTAQPFDESVTIIPDKPKGFTPNQAALDTLLGMGFPEPRAIKALSNTGNSDPEAAMNWLLEHMEDADIDAPLEGSSAPAELVANLEAMGFPTKLCTKALLLNGNDVSKAVEWLFSNPDDDGEMHNDQEKDLKDSLQGQGTGKYDLHAVVCHKGSSVHTGHYVAFVRDGDEWLLFNDEKVVRTTDLEEARGNGYIYFFRQKGN